MATEIKEERTIKCLSVKELYAEIYRRIEDTRPADCEIRLDHLKTLGIGYTTYYLIKNFVEGKELSSDRKTPMNQEKLSALMQKLKMEFIEPACFIKM